MTIDEKRLVLEQWNTFIKKGFRLQDFTDRVYRHLSLHCQFIAHYDKYGFYNSYFVDPASTIKFLTQFDNDGERHSVEYNSSRWLQGEYADINQAMCDNLEPYKKELYVRLNNTIKEHDLAQARYLLEKHGLKIAT